MLLGLTNLNLLSTYVTYIIGNGPHQFYTPRKIKSYYIIVPDKKVAYFMFRFFFFNIKI